jgi:hypothetical protein
MLVLGTTAASLTCVWEDKDSRELASQPNSQYLTADDIINLVRTLVRSTYIKNGNRIRKQIKGLPMGTNPAPHLADLDCYKKESTAMDRIASTNPALAQSFFGTYRYIDDILSADNPNFDSFVRLTDGEEPPNPPIYPDFLLLNKTTEDTSSTDFLGMNITSSADSFIVNVASSKNKFPVPKVNYPSLKGNFPRILAFGVFTGQLHRFARASTLTHDFLRSAIEMARLLTTKGYSKRKLLQYFYQFIRSKYPNANVSKAAVYQRFKNGVTNYYPRDA